ncbi:MAG TPA: DedA family protein [Candidatus Paceibacterota bacterium]
METLVWLIQNYGYGIVFVGTIFEGEVIVALAGFSAYGGDLKLGYIIPIAIVGAMIGDHAFFYFGRYKGRKFLSERPLLEARVEKVHRLLERYNGWIIFGSRFMYGFRALIPVALGVSKVSGVKFSFLNFLGAVVWGVFFAFGGYAFGGAIERFIGGVKKFEGIVVIVVVTLFIVTQVVSYIRRRRREMSASPEETTQDSLSDVGNNE